MGNNFFNFKKFTVLQDHAAMKIGVDSVILGAWTKVESVHSCLDIGCGTGVLGLMIAQRSEASILGVELDDEAVKDARINYSQSPWANRCQLIHDSIQNFHSANNLQFDLIISNPPYFHQSLKSGSESRDRARHSDSLSSNELIHSVNKLLLDNGVFSLILPALQSDRFIMKSRLSGLFCNRKLLVKPNANKGVNRVVMEFGKTKQVLEEQELIIYNEGVYTQSYKELTKEFYLKF